MSDQIMDVRMPSGALANRRWIYDPKDRRKVVRLYKQEYGTRAPYALLPHADCEALYFHKQV
jgi:hypothetical protein